MYIKKSSTFAVHSKRIKYQWPKANDTYYISADDLDKINLKYSISESGTGDFNAKVFSTLAWAGLLKDWNGPEEGERPSAYIVILGDLSVGKNKHLDVGITAQTIMLGAADMGLGGCMFGSIQREKLASLFDIDTEKYSIELVLALGKPKEEVRIVDLPESGSTAYYRDDNGVHYVPKRSVEDLIL